MTKTLEIDKGNDSLHNIGKIKLIGQDLEHSNLAKIFQNTHRSGVHFQDINILNISDWPFKSRSRKIY
jgi:hypothetical protein